MAGTCHVEHPQDASVSMQADGVEGIEARCYTDATHTLAEGPSNYVVHMPSLSQQLLQERPVSAKPSHVPKSGGHAYSQARGTQVGNNLCSFVRIHHLKDLKVHRIHERVAHRSSRTFAALCFLRKQGAVHVFSAFNMGSQPGDLPNPALRWCSQAVLLRLRGCCG